MAGATAASPLGIWLPIIGAAVAILGGFLGWIGQASAWDLGFIGVLNHELQDLANNDLSAGLILLLTALAAIPLLTRRPLGRWMGLALAGVATNVALATIVLHFDVFGDSGAKLGIGVFVTLIGGAAMAWGALMAPRARA